MIMQRWFAIFADSQGKRIGIPIYFQGVAQERAKAGQFADGAGLELHKFYRNQDHQRRVDQ